ncbi:hypothetical protein SLS62_002033 [Diatrype stigma]|uniref:Helicase ATP-binding domain-containing protein n=1 Tax=Diatrype stigma TaxID=117547 RepID=A0AAN9UV99_9PEZI
MRLTATGSLEKIPTDIDILIAGTPCVDFSTLNKNKLQDFTTNVGQALKKLFNSHFKVKVQTDADKHHMEQLVTAVAEWLENDCLGMLKDQGTSSGAFFAMLNYVKRTRPKFVLLENVFNAPWLHMTSVWFPSIGYKAISIKVDSKMFYIPQTRFRGYLLAVDGNLFSEDTATELLESWAAAFRQSERRASSPIDQWLLPSTDPLAELARQDDESRILDKKRRDKTPWIQSRRRHIRTRREKGLGDSRPLTNWTESGESKPHDRMDKIFISGQPPRVLDCLECYYLDGIMNGRKVPHVQGTWPYDIMFKTRVIDLSQNVDRFPAGGPFGLIGCVTPDRIPYITDQCRFLTGYEALQLQGLPIHRIAFSREDQEQLRDLAGNAMTVTVVGTALVALFTSTYNITRGAVPIFPRIEHQSSAYPEPTSFEKTAINDEPDPVENDFTAWHVHRATKLTVPTLVQRLRRRCYCNGVAKYSATEFLECNHCGIVRCVRCSGNPAHNFRTLDKPRSSLLPGLAALEIMSLFPSTVQFFYDRGYKDVAPTEAEAGPILCAMFPMIEKELESAIFYYKQVYVTEIITIRYAAAESFELRVTLSEKAVTWNLYLIPSSSLGKEVLAGPLQTRASDPTVLDHPIARATATDIREMKNPPERPNWNCFTFRQESVTLIARKEVVMTGEVGVPSKTFLTLKLANEKMAKLSEHARGILGRVITRYEHMPTCDTAEKSLFLSKDLFLFKDPSRTYDPDKDSYVVAEDCRLLEGHEHRDVLLKFHPKHQIVNLAPGQDHEVVATIEPEWFKYTVLECFSGAAVDIDRESEKLWMPRQVTNQSIEEHGIHVISKFEIRLPKKGNWRSQLASVTQGLTTTKHWYTVPRADYRRLSELLAPYDVKVAAKLMKASFQLNYSACDECCIKKPAVWWLTQNNQVMAYESPDEMKRFDSHLAQRRLPFEVQVQAVSDFKQSEGQRVGVRYLFNPAVLAHQASAHLPDIGAVLNIDSNNPAISQSAELQVQVAADLKFAFEPFTKSLRPFDDTESASKTMTQNTETSDSYIDPQGRQLGSLTAPPGFKGKLADFQANSLRHWLDREYRPKPFVERETEESIQPHINVRLVGRAERTITCRGGVVADDVGYGKTVVSLALMQMQANFDSGPSIVERRRRTTSRMHVKATLVIVPPHLVTQWQDEVLKFRGLREPDVLILRGYDALQKTTAAQIIAAKVIIASTSIFTSESYRAQLGKYSSKGNCPESKDSRTGGRRVQEWYEGVLAELDQQIQTYLAASTHTTSQREEQYRSQAQDIQSEKTAYEKTRAKLQSQLDYATHLRSQWKTNRKTGDTAATEGQAEEVASNKRAGKGKAVEPTPLDYKEMLYDGPQLLELYTFARVVYDEFSYDELETILFFKYAQAYCRWVLSATPPTRNLADICTTASLLRVHVARPLEQRVGLPSVTMGPSLYTHTYAEKVLSYGQLQSDIDVRERHQQGEAFLKHFASANLTDTKFLGIAEVTEHVIVCPMTSTENKCYHHAQHVLQSVGLDSDMLSKTNRSFLPKIHDRKNMNAFNASGYHLALAASCWPATDVAERDMVETYQGLLQEAERALKEYFDKSIWLCRRIQKYEDRKSQAHEIVKDFYCFIRDIVGGGSLSRVDGYDAFQLLFKSIFPGHDNLGSVERKIGQSLQGLTDAELVDQLWKLRTSSWPSYYDLTVTDVAEMKDGEVSDLLEDTLSEQGEIKDAQDHVKAASALVAASHHKAPTPLGEAHSQLESVNALLQTALESIQDPASDPRAILGGYAAAPDDDVAIEDGNDEYGSYKKDRLMTTCESRGIKAKSVQTKADLVRLLRRDDAGALTYDDYVEGKFISLRKRSFPSLGGSVKKRGTTFSLTHDDLLMTTELFDAAMTHAIQISRQSLVVGMTESGLFNPCRTCGSKRDLHLVYECGHCLCSDCVQGATLCGDSAEKVHQTISPPSRCPCVLQNRTIPQTGLKVQQRMPKWDRVGKDWVPSGAVEAGNGLSSKSAMLLNCILGTPKDEGVLLFVQYPELHMELQKALEQHGIKFTTSPEVAAQKKNTGRFKVCLLYLEKSESSGSNLQYFGNNVMFASPLNMDLQENYDKLMKQAIGRVVRYGQAKPVRIFHFVTERTIEVDMLELRQKRRVIIEPGEACGRFEEPKNPGPSGSQAGTHDAEGDTNMGGINPIYGQGSVATSTGADDTGSIGCLLGRHAVWRAMNEQNWLTTIGLDR